MDSNNEPSKPDGESQSTQPSQPIGFTGEGDSRCCVCAAHSCGISTMAGGLLRFHVCQQCHGNGDYQDWFLAWFEKEFGGIVGTPNMPEGGL